MKHLPHILLLLLLCSGTVPLACAQSPTILVVSMDSVWKVEPLADTWVGVLDQLDRADVWRMEEFGRQYDPVTDSLLSVWQEEMDCEMALWEQRIDQRHLRGRQFVFDFVTLRCRELFPIHQQFLLLERSEVLFMQDPGVDVTRQLCEHLEMFFEDSERVEGFRAAMVSFVQGPDR